MSGIVGLAPPDKLLSDPGFETVKINMKVQKTILFALFLFIILQGCFGQNKPQAILLNEITELQCENLWAQIDSFAMALQSNPGSQGYAVIYGENNRLRDKLQSELWIKGALVFRNYDPDKIIEIRGTEAGNLRIQLWMVPTGAEKPVFNEAKWNFALFTRKPFIFHDDFEQICLSVNFQKVYGEYLMANTQARGHIVIYANSLAKYQKEKKKTQSLLAEIPPARLRFFFVKSENWNKEFWIVPKNKVG